MILDPTMTKHQEDSKPIIGITMGDYNGIGPEVILKALDNSRILHICTPVIYGNLSVFSRYRKLLKLNDWIIQPIQHIDQLSAKKTNLIHVGKTKEVEIEPGRVNPEAGQLAAEAIKAAAQDLKAGKIDAVVTAPINKHNIQSEQFNYPGHTEFFTEFLGASDSLMLMTSDIIRIGTLTGHVPVQAVSQHITAEKLLAKIKILHNSLQQDFGLAKPKIAILGLNPHAGEEGLLGQEEVKIIRPVVIELKKKGALVFGPYSPDGFFASQEFRKFDGVLAMYHDQGLIPFKLLSFEYGVNYTAGLKAVRTSPDHGTAYDIAGKGIANETSLREALFLAADVVKNRREMNTATPL